MTKRISINDFAALAKNEFGRTDLRRRELNMLKSKFDVGIPMIIWDNKVSAGLFRIPGDANLAEKVSEFLPVSAVPVSTASATPVIVSVAANGTPLIYEDFNGIKVFSTPNTHSLIPTVNKNFVPWGNYHLIKKLINHDAFMTAYMVGETGNGKTMNYEQACAELKRELIIVPITAFTDEDDLFGGFRLVGGDTVWVDGPVIEAMKRGAILLLDEVDNGTEPLMSLQAILQGNSYFVKKLGRVIHPKKGFSVFATANTKGDGDGDYVFTNVLNKAFLDRFKILIEQPYPSVAVERKIVKRWVLNNAPHVGSDFINNITKFVDVIRNTYKEGGINEQISTRRLVDMTMMYGMLGNASEAIKLTTNRFDKETQMAMLTLWSNIDSTTDPDFTSMDHSIPTPAPVVEPVVAPVVDPTPVVAPAPAAPIPSTVAKWTSSPVTPPVGPTYTGPSITNPVAPAPVHSVAPAKTGYNSLPAAARSNEIPF